LIVPFNFYRLFCSELYKFRRKLFIAFDIDLIEENFYTFI